MARSKPYPFWLGIVDVILLLATGVVPWGIVMLVREIYRHNQKK